MSVMILLSVYNIKNRAFRFLVNVFGFIQDNLDPFNLFPLKEPIESNPTRNYDL